MTVPSTIFTVVVAAIGCEAARMSGDRFGSQKAQIASMATMPLSTVRRANSARTFQAGSGLSVDHSFMSNDVLSNNAATWRRGPFVS